MGNLSKDTDYLIYFAIKFQRMLHEYTHYTQPYAGFAHDDYAIVSIVEEYDKWHKAVLRFIFEHKDEINQTAFVSILLDYGIPSGEKVEAMRGVQEYKIIVSVESQKLLKQIKTVVEDVIHIFSQQDLSKVGERVVISKTKGIYVGNSLKNAYKPGSNSKIKKLIYILRDGGKTVKELIHLLEQADSTVRRAKSDINRRVRKECGLTEDLIIFQDPNYILNPIFKFDWKE